MCINWLHIDTDRVFAPYRFSQTSVTGSQFLVLPDQRAGLLTNTVMVSGKFMYLQ